MAQQDKSKRGLNDPRGHLFKEILRIAKHHKPTWLLLENVKGLTFKPNQEAFNQIIQGIKELGYHVNWKVLNARDFGLPQNRERVFFVANRLNLDFEFPQPTQRPTKAGDIFEQTIDNKYYLSEKTWSGLKRRKEANLAKGNSLGYKLFDENSPYINTLTTNSASEYVIKDGDRFRKLTLRECLRLQGFPEDYLIVVSDYQTYRQTGNAVAIPVVQAIGQ
ncbi:MAG: Modification methylase HpaII [Mycoplasmataceae bacterium]|nr:MAG: Modification methylase HpaII [Mycoplasmataceae bacterium]